MLLRDTGKRLIPTFGVTNEVRERADLPAVSHHGILSHTERIASENRTRVEWFAAIQTFSVSILSNERQFRSSAVNP